MLKHDAQGFLVGTPIDLSDASGVWAEIRSDVRAIRQSVLGRTVTPGGGHRSRSPSAPSARSSADQKAVSSIARQTIAAALPGRNSKGQFVGRGAGAGSLSDGGDGVGAARSLSSIIGKLSRAALNAGNGMEEADPTAKAFQEVAQPLARGYEMFSGGSEDKKQTGMLRRIFTSLNVFRKDETLFNKVANKSLKNIEEKTGAESAGGGGGILSSLGGLLTKMQLLGGMFAGIAKMLGKGGAGGLLGGIGKMFGKGGGGLLGGLGKGFLKRIPILGALIGGAFAWNESNAAENDSSLTKDEKNSAKGKAWGGAVGGVIGAAVGSLLGPVGTVAGAVIGDWLGGQFGEMLGGKWTAMTETISGAWGVCTTFFTETWDGITKRWTSFVDSAKSGWDTVANLFKSAYSALKSVPVIGPAIEAAEKVAKKATELASTAGSAVKDKAVSAATFVKDKTVSAAKTAGEYVAKETLIGRTATSAFKGTKDFGTKLLNKSFATGAEYRSGNIGGLDDANTRGLVASTAMTESGGGKLDVINKQGYMGRYQAGAGWLADAGMINGGGAAVQAAMKRDGFSNEWKWSESGGMTRFLDDSANWKEGLSKEKYLASADLQDTAFKANSDSAYSALTKAGRIIPGVTSQADIAGLLKARHLSGLGGAKSVADGKEGPKDANGTTARKYFNDVALDKHGLTAAYLAPSMPTATASSSAPSVPSSPSIPTIADAPPVVDPMASTGGKTVSVTAATPDVGQDLRERRFAHIVTGGMSA